MSLLDQNKKKLPWFYHQHHHTKTKYHLLYKPSSVQERFCGSCQARTMQVRLIEAFSGRIHWLCRSCGTIREVVKP